MTLEVLLVEDSPGDVRLTHEAFRDAKTNINLHVATDGVAAMAFLRHEGDHSQAPRPDFILLDLNLPRKDGREVLAEIKGDPALRVIPVVVLTTSEAEEDVYHAYAEHANCYIPKPVDFNHFTQVVRTIEDFWFQVVRFARPGSSPHLAPPPITGTLPGKERNGAIRVLVVEDSPTDRLLIQAALSEGAAHSYELTHAFRVAEATEKLGHKEFDIILTDLNLPDSTGLGTFRRINEAANGVPVIVLTTTDDKAEIQKCYDLGCNVYITKPVDYEGFATAIRQLGLFLSVMQVPETA